MAKKGQRIVTRRNKGLKVTSPNSDLSIQEAFHHFVNLKKTDGVKPNTIRDYQMLMGYFIDWLTERYKSTTKINEIRTNIIREYIVYLSEERFNEQYGLSPYTVNVRIRFLKSLFNGLFQDEIVHKNPCT